MNQTDAWNVISQFQPNVIIHTAAMTESEACEWNREEAYRVNVVATQMLAMLADMFQARLIFISTDLVFDGEKGDYSETDEPNPLSYYGETKLIAEESVKTIMPNSVILRTSLLLGKSPRGSRSVNERLAAEARAGKKVDLFFDEFRSPIFAQTLAQIIMEFAVGFASETTGLFHAGGVEKLSRWELGEKILTKLKLPLDSINRASSDMAAATPKRPKDVSLNITKLQTLLPYSIPALFE
jgi:dTDP-4-dehydrorhamnose reductase